MVATVCACVRFCVIFHRQRSNRLGNEKALFLYRTNKNTVSVLPTGGRGAGVDGSSVLLLKYEDNTQWFQAPVLLLLCVCVCLCVCVFARIDRTDLPTNEDTPYDGLGSGPTQSHASVQLAHV